MRSHAQRLAQHGDVVAVHERNHFTVNLVGTRTIKLKVTRQHGDVSLGCGHGLACVACFELRQLGVVLQHFFAQLHQQATTLERAHLAPRAI